MIVNLENKDVLYIKTPDAREFNIYYENNQMIIEEVENE